MDDVQRALLEEDELIVRLKQVHPILMENCTVAVKAFQKLLNSIDHNTQWDDYDIERKYGKRVLNAYIEADKAIQDIEDYFREDK